MKRTIEITPSIIARFEAKFIRLEPDDCWMWTAGSTKGYGQIRICGVYIYAHILSYMIAHNLNETPALHVLHTCDHPGCVNSNHLYEGTEQDNTNDKINRGRMGTHWKSLLSHCIRGHEYTLENTYINPSNGHRRCITCAKMLRYK